MMSKPKQKRTLLATLIALTLAIVGWWWFQSATTQQMAQGQPSHIETSTQQAAKSSKVSERPQPESKLPLPSGKTSFDELKAAAKQGDTQAMLALRDAYIICHTATNKYSLKNSQNFLNHAPSIKKQQFHLYDAKLKQTQQTCLNLGHEPLSHIQYLRLLSRLIDRASELSNLTANIINIRRLNSHQNTVEGKDIDLLFQQIKAEQNPDALFAFGTLMKKHRIGSEQIPDHLNGTDQLTEHAWQQAACRLGAQACQPQSMHTTTLCLMGMECRYNDYATYIDQSIAPADRQRFEWLVDEVIRLYRNKP